MKYKILIIILLLLANCYFLYKINLKEHFIDNTDKWKQYRLGDIYKGWNNLELQKHPFEYYDSIPKKYPNSIGAEYVLENKERKPNLPLLKKIVNKRLKNLESQSNNVIVLHLRIGDVITGYDSANDKFKYRENYAIRYEVLKKNINIFKNKTVYIFYGNHQIDINLDYSNKYLDKIRELFNKNNIKFIEKSNGNPDEDFLFMCNSKTFVKSGGGFSNLISEIVKSKNNNVIKLS